MYMYGEYETAEVANKGSVKVEEALSKTSCVVVVATAEDGRTTNRCYRKEGEQLVRRTARVLCQRPHESDQFCASSTRSQAVRSLVRRGGCANTADVLFFTPPTCCHSALLG